MKYDLVITSCKRKDLLKITLDSFKYYADIEPENVILIEDSPDQSVRDLVRSIYKNAEVILNDPQVGQMTSLQRVYQRVKNDYVFHCEDDWEFFRTGFILESFKLLAEFPKVSLISLRSRAELHPDEKKQPVMRYEELEYFIADPKAHPEWFSYSFNPGLRRISDLAIIGNLDAYPSESEVSLAFKKRGYYLAYLEQPAVRHIGNDRHVDDPSRPPKARSFIQKLKRSISKRINRIKRRLDRN